MSLLQYDICDIFNFSWDQHAHLLFLITTLIKEVCCLKIPTHKKVVLQRIHQIKIVGNKANGRISKRVFQEKKARQIFRKMNIFYPLIRTRTQGFPNSVKRWGWRGDWKFCWRGGGKGICTRNFFRSFEAFVILKLIFHIYWISVNENWHQTLI